MNIHGVETGRFHISPKYLAIGGPRDGELVECNPHGKDKKVIIIVSKGDHVEQSTYRLVSWFFLSDESTDILVHESLSDREMVGLLIKTYKESRG